MLSWELNSHWEGCQSTTFRSERKMPRIKGLMKNVLSSMSAAKLGTMPIQTETHSTPKWIRSSILPSMRRVCCMAVRELGIFLQWLRWFHSEETSDLITMMSPTSVSRTHRTVRMICEETPVRYVAFVCRLCKNCEFCGSSRERKFFLKAYSRRRNSLWWRWFCSFHKKGKQEVRRIGVSMRVSAGLSRHISTSLLRRLVCIGRT